ncbi:hypothetical protein EHF33_12150 [Deinococcus psychrotolerans]|uniref:Uncharacterized protein n=1 Tax=Deinococcus psychrotolerans TaxID=2489213 RepID=A0A3G8YLB2_9DEIO|nr:hypothetical protein [Deinococcus psychrotolerans]AZI43404.1 hypothetical protein EHF33_12150 [Deinococcus psychrotolerans]
MNDRILGALKMVGITDAPLASLDHEQQFFALTPQLLLFHGAEASSPLQQVTLRDISRIHSDHQGTLRVETSAGTSITASLLGFDPNRVQRFFQTVRDTTARAKQQPSSPLPSAGSKMFAPASPTPAPSASPVPNTAPRPEPIVLGERQDNGSQAASTTPNSGAKVVKIGGSATPSAAPSPVPAPPPVSPPSSTIRIEARPPISVNAASTLNKLNPEQQPSSAKPLSPAPLPHTPPPSTSAPTAPSSSAAPKAAAPKAASAVPVSAALPAADLQTSAPMSDNAAEQVNRLARTARSLGAQRWTLRILALVLVVGALGMGYVLWQQGKSSQLPALWTVTIGIVTAVGLLVMAELLKMLSLLGQVVSERQGGPTRD